MDIDIEKLRRELEDYYGAAVFSGLGAAVIDLAKVENASPQQLVEIALREGMDLGRFEP